MAGTADPPDNFETTSFANRLGEKHARIEWSPFDHLVDTSFQKNHLQIYTRL